MDKEFWSYDPHLQYRQNTLRLCGQWKSPLLDWLPAKIKSFVVSHDRLIRVHSDCWGTFEQQIRITVSLHDVVKISTCLLPLWCLHCFHTVYHGDGISVLGTDGSQKEPYKENIGHYGEWGRISNPLCRSIHGNLWRVGRGRVLQEQNSASQFSSPLPCNFLA